ncbi:hypothetical protein [Spirosoma migulaei]
MIRKKVVGWLTTFTTFATRGGRAKSEKSAPSENKLFFLAPLGANAHAR